MPVEYSGLIAEHQAVRRAAGLFDVSHMGEFEVRGAGALGLPAARHRERRREARGRPGAVLGAAAADRLPGRRRDRLPPRRGPLPGRRERRQPREGLALAAVAVARGLHARGQERRVRAARAAGAEGRGDPAAAHAARPRRPSASTASPRARVAGHPAIVARTGYTGEDGFELFVAARGRCRRSGGSLIEAGGAARARCRPASARATRCGSRRDAALRQRHGRDHHARRGGARLDVSFDAAKGDFNGREALHRAEAEGRAAQAGGLRDDRARHPAPRLPGLPRRPAVGRR